MKPETVSTVMSLLKVLVSAGAIAALARPLVIFMAMIAAWVLTTKSQMRMRLEIFQSACGTAAPKSPATRARRQKKTSEP